MSSAAANEAGEPIIPMPLSPTPGPQHLVGLVLKAPRAFAELVTQDRFTLGASLMLLLIAAGFCAVYGVSMGVFSGGHALWMSGLKVPLIALASVALCAPSLYVLLGLNGSPITLRQSVAILAGSACLASLLLAGFAPVAWLFGVSTSNVQFMVVLHLLVACIGIGYGLRLLGLSVPCGYEGNKVLLLWTLVFLLVSAQMVTYFRPLLTVSADGAFHERQKQFFFQHLQRSVAAGPSEGSPLDEAADPRATNEPVAMALTSGDTR